MKTKNIFLGLSLLLITAITFSTSSYAVASANELNPEDACKGSACLQANGLNYNTLFNWFEPNVCCGEAQVESGKKKS